MQEWGSNDVSPDKNEEILNYLSNTFFPFYKELMIRKHVQLFYYFFFFSTIIDEM